MEQTNKSQKVESLDGILVLGPGRLPFGYLARARTAAFYNGNNGHHKIPIIVTGGRGRFCKNMQETEASKLKRECEKLGIDGRVIKTEPEPSSNTYQNFYYSKGLIWLLKIKKLRIVTNQSHMKRALEYGKKAFNKGKIKLPECKLYPLPVRYDLPGSISELSCRVYESFIRPVINIIS